MKNKLVVYMVVVFVLMQGMKAIAASNVYDIIYPKVVIYHDSTNESTNAKFYALKLRNLIGHFRADVIVSNVEDYISGDMNGYQSSFYIGSAFDNDLPDAFYTDSVSTTNNMVWMNYNIWNLLSSTNDTSHLGIVYDYQREYYDQVLYKGVELFRAPDTRAIILDTNGAPVVRAVMKFSTNGVETAKPYVMQISNFWYIADNPLSDTKQGGRELVLADLLHDILGSGVTGGVHRALLRLEDFKNSSSRIEDMNVVVSNLVALNAPATYGVISRTVDPGQGIDISISESQEFQAALLNIRRGNGELIAHGYTHQHADQVSGSGWEFWDDDLGMPLTNDSWAWACSRVDAAANEFMKVSMPVTVWETPHYRASLVDYHVIADRFRLIFEQIYYSDQDTSSFTHEQLEDFSATDPSMSGQRIPYMIMQHSYGDGIVIPENIDYLSPGNYDSNGLEKNVSNKVVYAEKMKVLRDGVVSGYFHPYLGADLLTNLVTEIRGAGFTYVPMREIYRELPLELKRNTNELPDNGVVRIIDSTTDIGGDLVCGKNGNKNILKIKNTAQVKCQNVLVGVNDEASSNVLDISSSAGVNCEGVVIAGFHGYENIIAVTNAGVVVAAEGAVGYFAAASNNMAIIRGVGSVWSNHYGFYVGPAASGNHLLLDRGGEMLSRFGEIGGDVYANMNSAVVDGAGSVWSNSAHLVVGARGSGNELVITNGGCVFAAYAFVGLDYYATNSSLVVSGSNSCLRVANGLTIGADGPQSKLFVTDGASVVASNMVVGLYDRAVESSVTVLGGELNITNQVELKRGNVSFAYGSLATAVLLIDEGCTVQIGEGFDLDVTGVITNAGTIILQGSATIPIGILHNIDNGSVQSNSSVMEIAGDYISFSRDDDVAMTNRQISFTTNDLHLLQVISEDYGDDLAGFTANHAFGLVDLHGTVDVVNVVYSWSLSGDGALDLGDGSRFYYVDDSDWTGVVNLSGDAVFERIDIELSDLSFSTPENATLGWPAGSGILFSVEWVDNLVTGLYAPAISLRAVSNMVQWTDTGSVERLPPQQVPIRFYRLQAKP